jgi:glycosyltransferase involved in cell wall biosynthesis
MKILFDHQIFTIQNYGGISRYFTQIISHLPNDCRAEIAIKYSDNEYIKKAGIIINLEKKYEPVDKFMPGIRFKGKGLLFSKAVSLYPDKYADCYRFNEKLTIEQLRKGDFDVFHPTYYDDYFLSFLKDKPFVLTVHDMIYELYPEMLNDPLTLNRKARLIKRADHIIAVSDNTKKDIIEYYNIPESKISIIYHANSLKDNSIIGIDLPQKFFLYVGARDWYKNFKFLILCIAEILKKDKSLYIVCAGNSLTQEETSFLKSLDLFERFIVKRMGDEDLIELYKRAIALLFPSYYEGFGIPILEAFALGCPVILSKTSCFPEIAKDAALFFDPKSVSDIRSCVKLILENNSIRKFLILKGKARSGDFSWESSAFSTASVYTNCLKTNL